MRFVYYIIKCALLELDDRDCLTPAHTSARTTFLSRRYAFPARSLDVCSALKKAGKGGTRDKENADRGKTGKRGFDIGNEKARRQ